MFAKKLKCPRCGKRQRPELFTSSWCIHCTSTLMDDILCQIGTVVALSFVNRNEDAADNWDAARRWIRQLPKDYNCNINLYALLDSIQPDVLRYRL